MPYLNITLATFVCSVLYPCMNITIVHVHMYMYMYNESTKVQTLGAIPGHVPSEHALMKRVFEKVHALIKCRCN